MHLKNITLIISTILLASCASTFSNLTSIKKLKNTSVKDGESIVIFSAGAPKGCWEAIISINLLDQSEEIETGQVSTIGNFSTTGIFRPVFTATNYQIKSEFKTNHGFLHAKRLRAGEYYFYPSAGAFIYPNAPKANFLVKPNEIVYIGEYFVTPVCKINKVPSTGIFVNNKFKRDMEKAQELNPNIDYSNVVQRIMTLEGGQNSYSQDSSP